MTNVKSPTTLSLRIRKLSWPIGWRCSSPAPRCRWRDRAITIAIGILLLIGVAFALRMASVIPRGARDYTIDSALT